MKHEGYLPAATQLHWLMTGVLICAALLVLSAFADARAADPEEVPVVMLSAELPPVEQNNQRGITINRVTWIRELFRQTFLITVRDEFGLATRDAVLGEPVDADDEQCFHLSVLPRSDQKIRLHLRRGEKSVYEHQVNQQTNDGLWFYAELTRRAGGLRTGMIDALVDAGFEHRPVSDDGPDVLPEDIETLLQQMNHVSQFAAVRRLHQLMRREGESAAVLGGLARGYAHLSQLTLPVLDLRHRAFGARSLLYATRMVQLEPSSAVPHWHLAHAMLWMGYPNGAEEELETAEKKADDSDVRPPWLEQVEFSIDYDFEGLKKLALDESEDYREAAALQWYLRCRLTSSDAFNFEVGLKALEVLPYCNRIVSGLFDTAGVALNHRLSVMAFAVQDELIGSHLSEVEGLPADISDQPEQEEDTQADAAGGLARSLVQLLTGESQAEESEMAGQPGLPVIVDRLSAAGSDDRQEPSLHVLAGTLDAWQIQALFQRGHFLYSSLGVDAGDFVEASMPMLGDSPFKAMFAALGIPRVASPEQTTKVTSTIRHHEMNYSSVAYKILFRLPRHAPTADGTINQYLYQCWYDAGYFEDAYRQEMRFKSGGDRLHYARWFRNISEHAPLRFSEQIQYDWGAVSDSEAKWKNLYPGYPDLHWALARAQKTFGDIDRSIEYYDQYLQMVEDAHGYIGLAEAWYVKDPSDDKWISVLEKALECQDYGLTHSQAAQRAASTLMRDGRFEDALPWAELAAQAYSHSGLLALVHCRTGLGDFEMAEDLVRQVTERYQRADWYDWCVSTGQGDLAAAWEEKRRLMQAQGYAEGPYGMIARAIHNAVTNDEQAAMETLQAIRQSPSANIAPLDRVWVSLFEAVLADRLGDESRRDQILQRLAESGLDNWLTAASSDLAMALQKLVASGELSSEKIDQMSARHTAQNANWRTMQALFVGHALWTHGKKDAALEQWKMPAQNPDGWNKLLSSHWLRAAGVDPIHVEGRVFADPFLKKDPEPDKG